MADIHRQVRRKLGYGGVVGLKEGVQDLEDGLQSALWGSKELPPPRPLPLLPPTPWASHSVCLALYPTLGSLQGLVNLEESF